MICKTAYKKGDKNACDFIIVSVFYIMETNITERELLIRDKKTRLPILQMHKNIYSTVAKLVMLGMTKHFLKMYVFFVRFYLFYLILFFNSDFFYISDILMHDIIGYFRIFRF